MNAYVAEVVIECPLGCSDTVEKCLDINPSNGLSASLDGAPDRQDVTFTGASTIDTGTGEVCNAGQCSLPDSELVGGVRVFAFSGLRVQDTLKVTGPYSIAFVVDGDVSITGTLDVSADGSESGPGAQPDTAPCTGKSDGIAGGGGGGAHQAGGAGGTNMAGDAGDGGDPGTSFVPLVGGCGGATVQAAQHKARGGGGGGAVQLVSRTRISLLGAGVIDASGGGGRNVNTTSIVLSGGGGGSGGVILLEAPLVELNGPVVILSTRGGGGAAPSDGDQMSDGLGSDGGTGAGVAAGGVNPGYANGGSGGTGTGGLATTAPSPGYDSASTKGAARSRRASSGAISIT